MRALNFPKLSERSCNYGLFKANFGGLVSDPEGHPSRRGGVTPSVKRGYAKLSHER